jgi:hypothetical protein
MAMSDDKYTDIVSDGGMDPRNKQSEALDALTELSQEMEKARKQYEADNDDWWNGLTEQEREDAFYAVCKRIHKADLQDRGTYRYALYDVFGFDLSMYGRGMDCGYMAIHNAIYDGEDLQAMKGVTRFEVIDDNGRTYVKYLNKEEGIFYALQDDNRTLKVFIDELSWKEYL